MKLVQFCIKLFVEGKDKDTETLTTLSVITIQFSSVLFFFVEHLCTSQKTRIK